MFNLKRVLLPAATIAAAVTVSVSTAAEAAILSGQVSGTWDGDYDGAGGFNPGDAFTADYTYNDSKITTIIDSSPYYYSEVKVVPLLSLVFTSGNVSHTFDFSDFSTSNSFGRLVWSDEQLYYSRNYRSKSTEIFGYDYSAPSNNHFHFYAGSSWSYYTDSAPQPFTFAKAYSYNDPSYFPYGETYAEVIFSNPSPVTAVPTPALLPGLIGLGLGVLRKRKAQAALEQKM